MKTSQGRRHFLKASGLSLALPVLNSFGAKEIAGPQVKRLVCIGTYLGFHTPSFFPKESGKHYKTSPLLGSLDHLRSDFSLLSGLDHRAANGHSNWSNYLTGKGAASVSLDQIVAKKIGNNTRFESLQITCGSSGDGLMSYTKEGIPLPPISRPSILFNTLFSSSADKARSDYLLETNGSVLDLVLGEAKALQNKVNTRDAEKLDEYFTSVREVEQKLQKQRDWLKIPTPEVDFQLPEFDPIAPDLLFECEAIMYDLLALALETDQTRVASMMVPGQGQVLTVNGEKLSAGYHGLSHHGNDPAKIGEFNEVAKVHIGLFGRFLNRLKEKTDQEDRSLLDTTAIVYGSGMGDANTHNNSRLPMLLAGGGFKHGYHHAIDRDNPSSTTPLMGDLFLSVMEAMGLEEEKFGNASRNINDLLL